MQDYKHLWSRTPMDGRKNVQNDQVEKGNLCS
jgi:hypothetical protein